ncbi:hypothetical protein [Tenacibaculum ovolyticum]|nr:hypothetical protein [Tenacibaculum ovolyticum]
MTAQNLTIKINIINKTVEILNIKRMEVLKKISKTLKELGSGAGYALRH